VTDGYLEKEDPGPASDDENEAKAAERVAALAKLFESDGLTDTGEASGPIYWPALSAVEAEREWIDLRTWVEKLVMRFPHLDHHVIPLCWFRHNGHVEALVALHDYERTAFGESAPGTAAVDWHRAFRDIEARLREWTGQLACGATHEPRTLRRRLDDIEQWDAIVEEDVRRGEHDSASPLGCE